MLLAASAIAVQKPSFAATNSPQVGFVAAGSQRPNRGLFASFRAGLGTLGWTDGSNIAVLDRWAEDVTERLPAIVNQLIASGVDALVTVGTAATLAAAGATTAVPIVMVGVGDPIAIGVVDSLDHPGGNVTGLTSSSSELIAKRLGLLRELIPRLRRVAIIIRNDPGLKEMLLAISQQAEGMGLDLTKYEATTGRTLEFAFTHLRQEHCEAIYVVSGPLGPAKRAEIIELAAAARIPVIYSFRVFAAGGGLMSLATDDSDLCRRAAAFVDKMLRGARPEDLPVEPPTKLELVINNKTAKALGLTIPPSILARADEVIE